MYLDIDSYASLSLEQQQSYMRSLDTYRTVIAAQEFDFTKGLEKGREEGRAKGRAKGRAEEKILSAKKMKSKGFSTEVIAEITGLTEEEINRI